MDKKNKDEIRGLLKDLSTNILSLSRIVEKEFTYEKEEMSPNGELGNNYWYEYLGDENGYTTLIYKTEAKKGFGFNELNKWLGVSSGWNYSFSISPEHWQVALDADVRERLKEKTKDLYRDAKMIDQSKLIKNGKAIVTAINIDDAIHVNYDTNDDGEIWTVKYGNKLVFTTETGEWATPITKEDTKLKYKTWYKHVDDSERLIIKLIHNNFVGFYDGKTYSYDLGENIDNTQQEWVVASEAEVKNKFLKYTKELYPEGRNWLQIDNELNLYEVDHNLIKIYVHANSDVKIFIDELVLFSVYSNYKWPKRMEIETPEVGGFTLEVVTINDEHYVKFGNEFSTPIPVSMFNIIENIETKGFTVDDTLEFDYKKINHINLYLKTKEII